VLRKEAGIAENPFAAIPLQDGETVFRKPFSVDELSLLEEKAKADLSQSSCLPVSPSSGLLPPPFVTFPRWAENSFQFDLNCRLKANCITATKVAPA
jgi:hypothetical protein